MAILITWGCKRRGGGRSEEGERRGKKWDERGFCDCLKPISPSIQTEKTETGEIAASSQCSLIQPSLSTSFFSFLLSPLPLLNSKAGWRLTEIGSSTIDEHQHKKKLRRALGGGGGFKWEERRLKLGTVHGLTTLLQIKSSCTSWSSELEGQWRRQLSGQSMKDRQDGLTSFTELCGLLLGSLNFHLVWCLRN